jgi:hypothetical protein
VADRDPVTGRCLTRPANSGRKKGVKTRETLVREAAEAQAAQAKLEAEKDALEAEMMPVDFMLRAMRSNDLLYEQRFAAARAAAPY